MSNSQQQKVKMSCRVKKTIFGLMFLVSTGAFAIDSTLKIQYGFANSSSLDSIVDISGNGFNAKLKNGAKVKQIGRFTALDLGDSNGYLDMGSKTGRLIQALNSFSITVNVYVDSSVSLSVAGNFIWSFANSDNMSSAANGNMFLTARNTRYSISPTNWVDESAVSMASEYPKGVWKHIAYTQAGNTGTLYLNGIAVKTGTINIKPSELGATLKNYLGKSCYSGDAYLKKSLINDFRIYNRALPVNEIMTLASQVSGLDSAMTVQQVNDVAVTLTLQNTESVKEDIILPTNGANGVSIAWASSDVNIITSNGVITRPPYGSNLGTIKLTATISKNQIAISKDFTVYVLPNLSDLESVNRDSLALTVYGNLSSLRSNLSLSLRGNEGSTISWISNAPNIMSDKGEIITKPAVGAEKLKLTLTATILKGTVSKTKKFDVYVAEEMNYAGYLFAYFTGNDISQEAIRFATSTDAYTYRALNKNNPIISSSDISSTGGVRDPHILRGEEDNSYYMVATDMVSANGWSSNRAMVLLKSNNLTNWTSSIVNIPNTYPEYQAADRVWAPQTIYDPSVGKYMVYFSMRLGSSDYDKIYYAYANSSFTALESSPKLLFANPNGLATIDGDIVCKDGVYNLFFKTEGNGNGIKKAVSNKLTEGYVVYDKYLQSTTNAVEGGCVFKLYNSNNWILMYDMYTSGAYQFTTSTDLVNFSVVSTPVSFDFTPRHGTIIPVTNAELQALNAKWNTTGLPQVKSKGKLSVYPNPAKTFIKVTFDKQDGVDCNINIFDIKGTKMLTRFLRTKEESIGILNFNPGMYVIKCNCNNTLVDSTRFVVQ